MKCTFESQAVREAARDRRITVDEAERIVRTYQLSGTLNPEEGFAIERDVDRLDRGCRGVRVSKTAMGTLTGNIPGVQLLGGVPHVGRPVDHGARFESARVKEAVRDGRVDVADADAIIRTWQISGTIDPEEGWRIGRDVDKMLASSAGLVIEPFARFKLSQLRGSPQWF